MEMKIEEIPIVQSEPDRMNEQYASLYDYAPVAYLTMNADSKILNANYAAAQLLGMPRQALLQQHFADFVCEPSEPVFDAFVKLTLVSHSHETCEIAIHIKEQLIWVSVEAISAADMKESFHAAIIDITERKRIDERLRLTAHVYETARVSIMITDIDHNITDVNDAFSLITGYSRSEVLGKNPRLLQSGLQDKSFYTGLWHTINTTGHWEGELLNRRKNGEIYTERMTISAVTDENGMVSHYVCVSSDISVQKQQEKQLEHIAHYDALTGIPNRALLIDRMQQAMSQARREQKLLAVCYLDLDGFHTINDTLGQDQGDILLIEIARRISHALRGADTVARMRADQFAVLLKDIENINECAISLDRLLHVISQPVNLQGQTYAVTASIGVTLYPLDDDIPDHLIRHADQAMKLAKQLGKNRYDIFDIKLDNYISNRREQRMHIGQGFLAREFELFYQPNVRLATHKVVGAEALIRWRHPEHGYLPPSEFLPYIENCELDIRFGEWVIETALRQLMEWSHAGLNLDISVNVSLFHLLSAGFVDNLRQKLAEHSDIWPNQLRFEIKESAALSDMFRISGIMASCAALGVDFVLDHFGEGCCSLTYLRKLPAKVLKIDSGLIENMLENPEDCKIVKGIVAVARTFECKTVAQCVETGEQLEALSKMDCDIVQGYAVAYPMPPAEFPAWIRKYEAAMLE